MQRQPADEPLPAIIEEILTPTTAREPTPSPPAEPKPAEQKTKSTRTKVTGEDLEVVLELGGLKSLVEVGFDAAELQELEDVDPLEQDFSDDPLALLDLSSLADSLQPS